MQQLQIPSNGSQAPLSPGRFAVVDSLLIFDVETNGLDPVKDQVIEVAGTLFSVKHCSTVAAFSFCMRADGNAAESINGIPAELIKERGLAQADGWYRVKAWMEKADAIVAHNAQFDRGFCPMNMQDVRPWICSQDDIEWPRPASSGSLVAQLLSHGLGVSHAHRALVDTMNIARLFERAAELGSPTADLIEKAMRPKKRYVAVVSYETNALAKTAGFRWDPERKQWWRKLVAEDVAGKQYPFQVREAA